MKPATRHIVELRDAALALLQRHGTLEPVANVGQMNILTAAVGHIRLAHRTPFQPLPDEKAAQTYTEARLQKAAQPTLPYGLDVWAGPKVLSLQWDASDEVMVVSYKPGDWEDELKQAVH
jgi:hypothetical protein